MFRHFETIKEKGFSLIEVLIISGIMGIILASSLSQLEFLGQAQSRMDFRAEISEFSAEVTQSLRNRSNCFETLGNQPSSGSGIKMNLPSGNIDPNDPSKNKYGRYTEVTATEWGDEENLGNGNFRSHIIVHLKKKNLESGSTNTIKKFTVYFTDEDPRNVVESCNGDPDKNSSQPAISYANLLQTDFIGPSDLKHETSIACPPEHLVKGISMKGPGTSITLVRYKCQNFLTQSTPIETVSVGHSDVDDVDLSLECEEGKYLSGIGIRSWTSTLRAVRLLCTDINGQNSTWTNWNTSSSGTEEQVSCSSGRHIASLRQRHYDVSSVYAVSANCVEHRTP